MLLIIRHYLTLILMTSKIIHDKNGQSSAVICCHNVIVMVGIGSLSSFAYVHPRKYSIGLWFYFLVSQNLFFYYIISPQTSYTLWV